MMKRITHLFSHRLLALVFSFLFMATPVQAARHALIVANSSYQGGLFHELKSPEHDAKAINKLLIQPRFGFQKPTLLVNKSKSSWDKAFSKFLTGLETGDTVVVYYSGHGVQISGHNYLIPVSKRFSDAIEVKYHAINASEVVDRIQTRIGDNGLQVVILDACRDELTKGTDGAGLGVMNAAGAFIAYAASPGKKALGGVSGGLSLFTDELTRLWSEFASLSIERILHQTRQRVHTRTEGYQRPWVGNNMLGEFCLQTPCVGLQPESTGGADTYKEASSRSEKQRSKPIFPRLIDLDGGCFDMGQSPEEAAWLIEQRGQDEYDKYFNDEKQHRVCVEPFSIAEHEVTIREFTRFVNQTAYITDAENNTKQGCYTRDRETGKWDWVANMNWRNVNTVISSQMAHPVSCVSFNDAGAYVDWLNKHSVGDYRLPTEAEFEYAARGGTQDYYFWGNSTAEKACQYANGADQTTNERNSGWSHHLDCTDSYFYVAPAKSFKANPFAVYDLIGNLAEWTCSVYEAEYMGQEQRCDLSTDTNRRVVRGGAWVSDPEFLRSAFRSWNAPDIRVSDLGFRVVLAAP